MGGLLSEAARKDALAGLSGWSEAADGKALNRTFTFRDFNEAFGFMARAALLRRKATTIPIGGMSTKLSRSAFPPTMPGVSPRAMSRSPRP
ncbi:Putative pterin-4-alpha-carbinolamine dehydratase [Afipia felis]|uniref:4a-hydroxytetrahydrobiopterin dehydratase n=1 Tax=Afipia felis TaxID=1035 RepID=A0A090N8J6_AFIFE|nr:Putative pterin-4-alpha-carbinolamine dehydratase [Afipia felis]